MTAVVSAREDPDLVERALELTAVVWPEYNRHGDVGGDYWGRLEEAFPDVQFALCDSWGDVLASARAIPCVWNGTVDGLPDGIDGVLREGFAARERGERPNALSALAIAIVPARQGGGLSRVMIEAMRFLAREQGLAELIAPVRPSSKERYPLTPIERYAFWTDAQGLPFDPWIRVHHRVGGELLRPEPHSMRITGTCAEWEAWTEMRFPESGDYVFPHGLAPVTIDVERDLGAYWEPNVWMRHRVS